MYMHQVVKCYKNNWIKILISLTICTEKRVEQFRKISFHFPSHNSNNDRFMIVYYYTFIIQHKNNSSVQRYMYHHMHALMVQGWKTQSLCSEAKILPHYIALYDRGYWGPNLIWILTEFWGLNPIKGFVNKGKWNQEVTYIQIVLTFSYMHKKWIGNL